MSFYPLVRVAVLCLFVTVVWMLFFDTASQRSWSWRVLATVALAVVLLTALALSASLMSY